MIWTYSEQYVNFKFSSSSLTALENSFGLLGAA